MHLHNVAPFAENLCVMSGMWLHATVESFFQLLDLCDLLTDRQTPNVT